MGNGVHYLDHRKERGVEWTAILLPSLSVLHNAL